MKKLLVLLAAATFGTGALAQNATTQTKKTETTTVKQQMAVKPQDTKNGAVKTDVTKKTEVKKKHKHVTKTIK